MSAIPLREGITLAADLALSALAARARGRGAHTVRQRQVTRSRNSRPGSPRPVTCPYTSTSGAGAILRAYSSPTATRPGRARGHRVGRGAGVVYRRCRDLGGQLRRPDPVADRAQRPPALRAMVSLVTPSDPFVEHPTGLPNPMHINWHRYVDGRMPQFRDDMDWMAVYRHRPLATMDEAAGFASPGSHEEMRHRTLDEWWEPVRYQHRIGEIDVPVLHISGWYDDEEIGTPANFAAMVAAGRAGQRLLMGPWGNAVNTTPDPRRGRLRPGRADRPDARSRRSSTARQRHPPDRRPRRYGSSSWAPTNGATRDLATPRRGSRTPLFQRRSGQQPVRRRPPGYVAVTPKSRRTSGSMTRPAGAFHHRREQRADRRPG